MTWKAVIYHHPLIQGAAPVFVAPLPLNSASPVSTLNAAAPVFVGASSANFAPSAVLLQIVPIAVGTSSGVKAGLWQPNFIILEKFAYANGLVGKDSPLQLGTINSSGEPVRSRKVSFHVYAVEGPENGVQITVEEAWTIPQLNLQGAREQTYWRQKGSKDFVKRSPSCRRLRAKPKPPVMVDLLDSRLPAISQI